MGTFYPGMKVNPLDLSPNYAGSLMALTNGIGAMTGVAAPSMVGYMTPNVSIFLLSHRERKATKTHTYLNIYIFFLICSHHSKNGELFSGFRSESSLLQRLFIRFGLPAKFNHGMNQKNANHLNLVMRNITMAMTESKLI